MVTKLSRFSVVALAAVLLIGCGTSTKEDEVRSEKELYESAFKALDRGHFETAIDRYNELESIYPFGEFSTQGQLEIAYAYYKAKEPENALTEVNKFIEVHPTHPNLDYAYYLKALAHLPIQTPKLGELWFKEQQDFNDHSAAATSESFEAFREVIELFPLSDYAESARRNMINLMNVFARSDIRVAKFYLNRRAYIGAINRANSVLDNYPNSELTEEALAILTYSYKQLELDDLAADSRRVLNLNFPGSKYLITENAVTDQELLARSERKFLFGLFR